mgnify:FL=1
MNKATDTNLEKLQDNIYSHVLLGARINGKDFIAYEHESVKVIVQSADRLVLLSRHTDVFRKKLAEAARAAYCGLVNRGVDENLLRELEILAYQAERTSKVGKA